MTTPVRWGLEFLVNTTISIYNYSLAPSISAFVDGRFVVTWSSFSRSITGADPSFLGIYAQIFNADGSKSGVEFVVNTTTLRNQYDSAITTLTDGRFVVSWTDDNVARTGPDKEYSAIRAQVFNADGSLSGAEWVVNTKTAGGQIQSAITALTDGRFVVSWTDYSVTKAGTPRYDVRAQIFNSDGSIAGAEFLVHAPSTRYQLDPAISALADGRFVVSWTDYRQTGADTSFNAIRAQVFNADGSLYGTEFVVNTTTLFPQWEPAITTLTDGKFVVSWTDQSNTGADTSEVAIRAQVFNADGSRSGAEFLVNSITKGQQYESSVTALADGRFVVSWTDDSLTAPDRFNTAIHAQVFNTDGSRSGAEFLVNTKTAYYQVDSVITALADGRFVITWSDGSIPPSSTLPVYAVRAQIFDPREAAVSLTGTTGDDDFVGTGFDDQISGGSGRDTLAGAAGNDTLSGDLDNDTLFGGSGNDRVFGGGGNDRLTGGAGVDRMAGNGGADVFVFATGSGTDTVTDFTDGADRIDLSAYGFATAVAAKAFFTNVGPDVVFTFGADQLVIENYTKVQIGFADLIL